MKIAFSGLGVVEASGKLGDDVTSRTRHGFYTRSKGLPNFPQTSYQELWNNILADCSSSYSQCTPDQIDAWNRARYTIRRQRYLPSQSPCTGQRAFVHFNSILQFTGAGIIYDPPAVVQLPATECTNLYSDVAGPRLEFDVPNSDDLKNVLIWASPGLPGGRRYWRNQVRLLTYGSLTGGTIYDLSGAYSARFTMPSAGDFVVVILVPFDPATGQTGAPQLLTTVTV